MRSVVQIWLTLNYSFLRVFLRVRAAFRSKPTPGGWRVERGAGFQLAQTSGCGGNEMGLILGLYIGIMEKKMETTVMSFGVAELLLQCPGE